MAHIRIGIIGAGATSLYILKELLNTKLKFSLVIYETNAVPGSGMPYSGNQNADYMLCNAFSREIPVVTQSLVGWLHSLPKAELSEWELSTNDVHARAFYPRVLIGEFLQHEFAELVCLAEKSGVDIVVRCNEKVVDVGESEQGHIFVQTAVQSPLELFDHVIIATGHVWSSQPMIGNVALTSPWPYSQVTSLRVQNVGILGSSLSAIDCVVALGFARGTFSETSDAVTWAPNVDQQDFKATMYSKMGIMPEGDFYYKYPYEALEFFTAKAVQKEIDAGRAGLLNRIFNLLLSELNSADPSYLEQLGDDADSIEGFGSAYFRRRRQLGGLPAVKKDFDQVRRSMRDRQTIPHRYLLLRAHEIFDLALRSLDDNDWEMFRENLLPVFADCYAAVPHLSIARIIAMYDAGVLSLMDTGNDAEFNELPDNLIAIVTDDQVFECDVLIDARGQASAKLGELPFPSLVALLRDKESPITAPYKLDVSSRGRSSVYCVSMPQLLEKHPFSQGLQNCSEVAKTVVENLVASVSTSGFSTDLPTQADESVLGSDTPALAM